VAAGAAIMTRSEVQLMNETLFSHLTNPGMIKTAIDAVNDFTRIKMREDGFARRIMPPLQIANDELDRQVDTDKPVKIVDKEPDSPAAISIPFATLPTNVYIRGPRYRVAFDRIVTPRFTKDVDELRTWVMDIRQVLSDNAIKDMLAEEDSKLIGATNLALIGPDTNVPWSGVPQWETIYGGVTRDSVLDALKIMPGTDAHLETATVLINNITIKEVQKWGRDEMGGDFSQDVLRNGWSETDFLDKRWIISIKTDLIPNDTIFMYADPKFIGKMYLLEDTTMYIKREAYLMEFFAYETMGGTIGHTGGLARADFA
jgi:hypothetical protein